MQSPLAVLGDDPMELIASSRLSRAMDRIARASALVADEHQTGTHELEDAAREIAALDDSTIRSSRPVLCESS